MWWYVYVGNLNLKRFEALKQLYCKVGRSMFSWELPCVWFVVQTLSNGYKFVWFRRYM